MMFRPKSKLVEARRWTGDNLDEMREWLGYAFGGIRASDNALRINNRTGKVFAYVGEWIVQDENFDPMETIKFEASFERA
jgi:hypothetical protein